MASKTVEVFRAAHENWRRRDFDAAVSDMVEYFTYQTSDVHILEWRTGGIVTVGSANFTAELVAGNCVDAFANGWLKWNPDR